MSDPVGDVRAHLAEGDFRPIGLGHGEQSWSCTLPGQQQAQIQRIELGVGARCLRDARPQPNDATHEELVAKAMVYAGTYNDALINDTGGRYFVRFMADGLLWTIPDNFETSIRKDINGKVQHWELRAFWRNNAFGRCIQPDECQVLVRVLSEESYPRGGISSSPHDGSDLHLKLMQTSLSQKTFSELRYIGSESKMHYFIMEPRDVGYVTCWSTMDKYVAPTVEPGIDQRKDLTCWATMEMPNRSEILAQVEGASLGRIGSTLKQLRIELLAFHH
ncbi:hypothetical protein ISN75_21105 [Dyella marensis]|uniref:hypothetical protein n=1 Tax=Dyella TaxID=231454 RepID=UPI001447DB5D|nr:hypothetical protein [Dyella sp. SG609]NKJ23885.1 hypothetical protein [Dyella sp. SG609]